jgi:hypothetical protein
MSMVYRDAARTSRAYAMIGPEWIDRVSRYALTRRYDQRLQQMGFDIGES